MRIHHLNCVSSCPLGGYLMDARSKGLRGRLTCHCLLLELADQLVLVDTGFGLRDVDNPRTRLSRFFLALTSPEFRREMTAIRQIERLGFDPRAVRHILLSHLDFDHAGGLDDFPEATVHLMLDEKESAFAQKTWLDRRRYRPQQWSTQARWVSYQYGGENWFGFVGARPLRDLPPEILMVPLPGHTLGHAGIALRTGERWLLYAADAYFFHAEMDLHRPACTPGLRFYQWMMEKDRGARLRNQHRLRALKHSHGDEVSVFCAHDAREFERLAGRSERQPAARPGPAAVPLTRVAPSRPDLFSR